MTSEVKKILDHALALPQQERQIVAHALLDSLPHSIADDLEAEWLEEARRRAERLERGEVTARDGAAVLAELEIKLRRAPSP